MQKVDLSIVIPAYNEAGNLRKGCLREVIDYLRSKELVHLKEKKWNVEILIVDDGSTDETANLVKEEIKGKLGFRLIKEPHGGKAITVMRGLLESKGEIALFTDMDQATSIFELEKLLPKFKEGYDVVIGSRKGRKGAPLIRKLAAFGFSTIRNLSLGLPFKDTQCGFKAFNRRSIEMIFPKLLKNWTHLKVKGGAVNAGFDVEVLFLAKKLDLKIAEVEVMWHHVGTERVQIVQDSIEALEDVFRIRLNDYLGRYKLYNS